MTIQSTQHRERHAPVSNMSGKDKRFDVQGMAGAAPSTTTRFCLISTKIAIAGKSWELNIFEPNFAQMKKGPIRNFHEYRFCSFTHITRKKVEFSEKIGTFSNFYTAKMVGHFSLRFFACCRGWEAQQPDIQKLGVSSQIWAWERKTFST